MRAFSTLLKVGSRRSLKNGISFSQNARIMTATRLSSHKYDQIISDYKFKIEELRGTPELADFLQYLTSQYPGIEMNIELYRALYPFPLDSFQEEGLLSLINGRNVIVMTPTGSGKTLVGELAIYFSVMMGLKVAYTTPLKALSNQKFSDFRKKYGGDRVGLLTGDTVINHGAPLTVMTTEVFRNIIYDPDRTKQLSNFFMVVFDEFHYMNDPERGTVWEESVISCPSDVRILALSATMGNADDVRGWMESIHGPTELVQSNYRPVPLRYYYGISKSIVPFFKDPQAGPGAIHGIERESTKGGMKLTPGAVLNPSIEKIEEKSKVKSNKAKGSHYKPNSVIPSYRSIVEQLQELDKLPAIIFIFSRVGCDDEAAKLLNSPIRLLNKAEVEFVNQAITNFILAHPEIPINKRTVAMLQAGIGVHHAGLISVWKVFIEDLFNANKIKVLFATETLAAGVNMPARTTVISAITKKIKSEIIFLKTSQLLQMAGRAGRRGKDEEGNVVIMRNRNEDANACHRILTSKIDGIKSQFKASYSLIGKLLATKSLEECRAIVERGFGAYIFQKRQSKIGKKKETHQEILLKYTLPGARDFFKLYNSLEKEKRGLRLLIGKESEWLSDRIEMLSLGTGLVLTNNIQGYFLGDVVIKNSKIYTGASTLLVDEIDESSNKFSNFKGYAVLDRNENIYLVRKEHIYSIADDKHAISEEKVLPLLEMIPRLTQWEEETSIVETSRKMMYKAYLTPDVKKSLEWDLETLKTLDPFPSVNYKQPGAIAKQQHLVNEITRQLQQHPVSVNNHTELVIEALRYVSSLPNPQQFLKEPMKSNPVEESNNKNTYAWQLFQSVVKLMTQYQALEKIPMNNEENLLQTIITEDEFTNETVKINTLKVRKGYEYYQPTVLGRMIASLSSDNELFLSLILSHPKTIELEAFELGAVIAALMLDPFRAENARFVFETNDKMANITAEFEGIRRTLELTQEDFGIDFPLIFSPQICGTAIAWMEGQSWKDLCASTSLDQGDLFRIFRRTVEVLLQIPHAHGVHPTLSAKAVLAAQAMDRFPIADLPSISNTRAENSTTVEVVENDEITLDLDLDSDLDEITSSTSDEEITDILDELLENMNQATPKVTVKKEKKASSTRGQGFTINIPAGISLDANQRSILRMVSSTSVDKERETRTNIKDRKPKATNKSKRKKFEEEIDYDLDSNLIEEDLLPINTRKLKESKRK